MIVVLDLVADVASSNSQGILLNTVLTDLCSVRDPKCYG
jgi:hypothetical protein